VGTPVTDAPSMHPGARRARLSRTVLAVALRQGVFMAAQVIQIPLFLHFWDIARYGHWLVLTAIPAYLDYAHIGLPSAAVNEMVLRAARGDRAGVIAIFSSALRAVGTVIAAVGLAILIALQLRLLPGSDQIQGAGLSPAAAALTLLILYTAAGQLTNLLNGGLSASGRNPLVVTLAGLSRLFELLGVTAALVFGGGMAAVAGAMVAVRLVMLVLQLGLIRRYAPWLRFSPRSARWRELRPLLSPAAGYLGWGMGNAMTLQGFVIVVSAAFGPVALVSFNTMRTLTRIINQCLIALNDVVFVEVGLAFGAGETGAYRHLHDRACQVALWFSGAASLLMIAFGPLIHRIWTHGRIPFNGAAFDFLVLAVFFQSLWSASSVSLSATNRHLRVSAVFALIQLASVATAFAAGARFGLAFPAMMVAASDMVFFAFILTRTLPAVDERWWQYAGAIVRPPRFLFDNLMRRFGRAPTTRMMQKP